MLTRASSDSSLNQPRSGKIEPVRSLSPSNPFKRNRERQWTVLYYGAGNNNLSRDLNMEMGGLRNAGSSDEVQLVAQLAGDDGEVERGEMARIPVKFGAVRPEFVAEEKLQADMGKKETLADFLAWGMEKYPAKYYLVIQAGHGNGHRGSMTDESTGSIMSPVDQREAFAAAPHKVDVLLKESCMGANLEEAYEMRDSVGYYLGSQDLTKGSVDLHGVLQETRRDARKRSLSPRELVDSMCRYPARGVKTFSAVDCSKLGAVGEAVSALRSAIDTPQEVQDAREVAQSTTRVDPNFEALLSGDEVASALEEKRLQYRDSVGFAEGLSQRCESLRSEATSVEQALREAIIYSYSDTEHAGQTGLSWNISHDPGITAGAGYRELAFSKDTGWSGIVS